MTQTPYLAALQAALAGEHAAVWACGRAAAELSGTGRAEALELLDVHRESRDELRRQLVALDVEPVAAAPAYQEPFDASGRRGARRLLAHVERGLAATYADLAALSPASARRAPAGSSAASAVRAVRWGAEAESFPGSP